MHVQPRRGGPRRRLLVHSSKVHAANFAREHSFIARLRLPRQRSGQLMRIAAVDDSMVRKSRSKRLDIVTNRRPMSGVRKSRI